MGTDGYLKYLQSETPGELETSYTEDVDKYIKEAKKANDEKKKQHFGMSFENPLKGYPYNEQFGFDKNLMEIEEDLADIELDELINEEMPRHLQQISKMFKTKNQTEIKGIDKLVTMSSMSVVMDMQKQNPQGFKKTVAHIGKLREEIEILDESNPDAALKKKADKTGMPLGILKKVFKRGVAAWRTGHRPGTNPTQWGLARVNSFVTKSKGTWGGADQDLAKQVGGK